MLERAVKIKSFTSSIRKIINLDKNNSKNSSWIFKSSQCRSWSEMKQARRIAEVELVNAEAHENEKKEQSDTPLDDILWILGMNWCVMSQENSFIEDLIWWRITRIFIVDL